MIASKRVLDTLTYPFHAVLFQYHDRPKEWHVCCIENGAFGWGNTPDEAIHELALTLKGQIEETFNSGTDFFFAEQDDEWRKAFETGTAPGPDIRLVARFAGELVVQLHGKAKTLSLRLNVISRTKELEPA